MESTACKVCGKRYSRKDALKRHIKEMHSCKNEEAKPRVQLNSNVFLHPFTMVVSGPTGCGKSEWVRQLLTSDLISPQPERIIFLYKRWQSLYDTMHSTINPKIEFIPEIPKNLDSDEFIDPSSRNVIILDDLMTVANKDRRITNLFCEGSHHRNLSVISLNQNLYFGNDPTQRRNTQYMILFKNPIDKLPVMTLARQMYPNQTYRLMSPFEEATTLPYGHLVIDLKPHTSEDTRLRANIFKNESLTVSEVVATLCERTSPSPVETDKQTANTTSRLTADTRPNPINVVTAVKQSANIVCHPSEESDSECSLDCSTYNDKREDCSRTDDDRCYLILMTEAKKINNTLWFTKYNALRKMGHNEKEAITHAWDLMVAHDKSAFLELYENLLHKLLLLWRDYKHHKIFADALSSVQEKGELKACREAIQKYKHLFNVAELQLESDDAAEVTEGKSNIIRSDSVEY